MKKNTFIGTAGWSIPQLNAARFPGEGQHLHRYAHVLRCAEINSSFKRSHRFEVYRRWSEMTPADFRFSVKLPAAITHIARLQNVADPLAQFLDEAAGLGSKFAVLLVQLPPSLQFDATIAHDFFQRLTATYRGAVVCEPRHPTWLEPAADELLVRHRVGRVAADPAKHPEFGVPGGWLGNDRSGHDAVVYCRLHGAPRVYWSSYTDDEIGAWAERIAAVPNVAETWCIFDNTASGAALPNALNLIDLLDASDG